MFLLLQIRDHETKDLQFSSQDVNNIIDIFAMICLGRKNNFPVTSRKSKHIESSNSLYCSGNYGLKSHQLGVYPRQLSRTTENTQSSCQVQYSFLDSVLGVLLLIFFFVKKGFLLTVLIVVELDTFQNNVVLVKRQPNVAIGASRLVRGGTRIASYATSNGSLHNLSSQTKER